MSQANSPAAANPPLTPLQQALAANDLAQARALLRRPAIDWPAAYRWRWARHCTMATLQFALGQPQIDSAARDDQGRTILHDVVYDREQPAKINELLARQPQLLNARQADGTTPLYRAALAGNLAGVRLLLAAGADPELANKANRWTPLLVAAAQGEVDILRELLAQPGLNLNAQAANGDTALHLALRRGHRAGAALLVAQPELAINQKNGRGWTPLMEAAFAGDIESARQLLARSAINVNLVDQQRQTALHWAIASHHEGIARLLLAQPGCNPHISNRPDHLTPGALAAALGQSDLAALIADLPGADALAPGDTYQPPMDETTPPPPRPFIADPPIRQDDEAQ